MSGMPDEEKASVPCCRADLGNPGSDHFHQGHQCVWIQPSENIWWLLLITIGVLTGFFLMFRKIVHRYCERIASLPDKVRLLQTFPLRGWILLIFMMSLGIVLKHIPGIPSAFTASFYSGLGPMLLLSAIRFISQWHIS